MNEPRQPFQRVFGVGQAQYVGAKKISEGVSLIPRGSFMFVRILDRVLDWDGVWWEFNHEYAMRGLWPWTQWDVHRNLLLQPIEDSATVSELDETKGEST